MGGMALCMQAQQTAVKAVADGHYLGAKQQLERFLEENWALWPALNTRILSLAVQ